MLTIAFFSLAILMRIGSVGGRIDIEITFPEIQPVYVKSGSKLELVCEGSGTSVLNWSKAPTSSHEYQLIDSNNNTGVYFARQMVPGKEVVSLLKDSVTLSDEGSYKCYSPSMIRSAPYIVEVYVIQVSEEWGVITTLGASATIGCMASSKEPIDMEMFWVRSDETIDPEVNPDKYNVSVFDSDNTTRLTLVVKKAGEADIGIYQCHIKLKNGNKFIHEVNLYAYSQVKPMGRSKNLVEGSTLDLTCKAWGWPLPSISWDCNGRPLNLSDDRISVTNGTLMIKDVAGGDRAVYVCSAWNSINSTLHETRASILVRVKGKLAIVWPLVGIALEVIILSCIICVYERNRARQRAEEGRKEAADHQSNSNAQPRHQGRDNVRYRK